MGPQVHTHFDIAKQICMHTFIYTFSYVLGCNHVCTR